MRFVRPILGQITPASSHNRHAAASQNCDGERSAPVASRSHGGCSPRPSPGGHPVAGARRFRATILHASAGPRYRAAFHLAHPSPDETPRGRAAGRMHGQRSEVPYGTLATTASRSIDRWICIVAATQSANAREVSSEQALVTETSTAISRAGASARFPGRFDSGPCIHVEKPNQGAAGWRCFVLAAPRHYVRMHIRQAGRLSGRLRIWSRAASYPCLELRRHPGGVHVATQHPHADVANMLGGDQRSSIRPPLAVPGVPQQDQLVFSPPTETFGVLVPGVTVASLRGLYCRDTPGRSREATPRGSGVLPRVFAFQASAAAARGRSALTPFHKPSHGRFGEVAGTRPVRQGSRAPNRPCSCR